MAAKLALELTTTEARALLASGSESRVKIQKFVRVPIGETEDEQTAQASANPEQAVVDALAANGISRAETVLVVGREDVELRLLNVPTVPDAELPEIVRFQAMQEMPGIGEKTPLDFLPLGSVEPEGDLDRVLAAVLKPRVMERFERICEKAKLTSVRMVLRPTAAASLALRQVPDLRDGCSLLVDILGRVVDFAAIHQGRVVFLRHLLLAGDPKESEEAAENLVAEIRRTRVAVASQENVEIVERIALMGNGPAHEHLAKRLTSQIGTEIRLIDSLPASIVVNPTAVAAEADSCAALLGAVLDETGQKAHAYDFLHPRKAPPPPNRRNRYAAAGLAVACLILAVLALNWWQGARLKSEINDLKQQAKTLEPQVEKADKLIADAGAVAAWLKSEVIWIEELAWLSERFPKAEDAMLTNLSVGANDQQREMQLTGYAKDPATISAMDGGLRDETHQVIAKRRNENPNESDYDIQFRSSVRISPEDASTGAKRTPSRSNTPQRNAGEGERS